MTYKDKAPQVISILTRKLKPGKTFKDFEKAHLPPVKATKTNTGYDAKYFDHPVRVLNMVSTLDPSIIISIGMNYGDPKKIFEEVQGKLGSEKLRHDKIAEVADVIAEPKIFFTASDNNFGTDGSNYSQLPFTEVTDDVVNTMLSFFGKI